MVTILAKKKIIPILMFTMLQLGIRDISKMPSLQFVAKVKQGSFHVLIYSGLMY